MTTRTRDDILFDLRYACRVLERYACMHAKLGMVLKFFSLLSGTAALAALVGDKSGIALGLGLFFALLQALEHAVGPGDKAANASAMRKEYARLYARAAGLADEVLDAGYHAIVADDDISVPQGLKELAFNDVICERSLDASACYPARPFLAALS